MLDAAKRERIIALVANGSSRRIAARLVGCSPSTITRTAARDAVFADALARAEEAVEVDSLRAIRRAAQTDRYWRAAAWLLERRNPEDYARRGPRLYSAAQVADMFAEALATLSPQMAETPRLQAMQKLSTLLLEFDGPPAPTTEPETPVTK
jgi:IS30 family transposase